MLLENQTLGCPRVNKDVDKVIYGADEILAHDWDT